MKVDTRKENRRENGGKAPHSMLDFMRLNAKLVDLDVPVLHQNTGHRPRAAERSGPLVRPFKDIAPIYRHFASALNTHVYLENAREKPPSRDEYELLCYCMISSATLAEGIKRAIKFVSALNGRGGTLALAVVGDKALVTCESAWKNRSVSALSLDMLSITFYCKLFAWLIDEPLAELELIFSHKSLLDPIYLQDLMSCQGSYEGTDNTIVFSKSLLLRPIIKTPRQLAEILARGPVELLPNPEPKRVSARVQSMLRKALVEQEKLPALDRVAYHLGQSGSTLRRRLIDEGTSFQLLLDECRKTRALELLARADLTIDEISSSLGFSERSSFSHAFKAWTSQGPSTYRDMIRRASSTERA